MAARKNLEESNERRLLQETLKLAYKEYAEEPMADFYTRPLLGIPSRARVKKIVQSLARIKGRVLDIGCEAGYVCHCLWQTTPAQVFGVDPCIPALLDFKKGTAFLAGRVSLCSTIAQEICFQSGVFDAVICTEVLEHTPDIDGVFAEVERVLKKDGLFILTLPYERVRKLVYPLLTLCGINTEVEREVNLFNYEKGVIEEKLGVSFRIDHATLIFRFFPLTYFYCCRKK